METVNSELFDFAFCMRRSNKSPEKNMNFEDFLAELANLAMDENWGENYSILRNYILHTYKKLANDFNNASTEEERQKIIAYNEEAACWNTGLFTDLYEPIYAYFEKNKFKGKQPWFLIGFRVYSDHKLNKFPQLPERAQFFTSVDELVYDHRLDIRANVSHILQDEENVSRLPEKYREYEKSHLVQLFEGAIQIAKKKVSANYKLAVPQYYNNTMQLLIPISFDGKDPDLALAIKKEGSIYIARTCLTLEMAYNNARLIVKPEVDWLKLP